MRNHGKKILIFTLAFFLSFISIFCCCLTGSAQAGMNDKIEQNEAEKGHCCSKKTEKSKSAKECDCAKTAAILVLKGFDHAQSAYAGLGEKTFLSQTIEIYNYKYSPDHRLPLHPSVIKSDPPIYLQDFVLRI